MNIYLYICIYLYMNIYPYILYMWMYMSIYPIYEYIYPYSYSVCGIIKSTQLASITQAPIILCSETFKILSFCDTEGTLCY